MKKLILVLLSSLFLFVACDLGDSKKSGDSTNEPYAGSWVDSTDSTVTMVFSDNYFTSNSPLSGETKGTLTKKAGTTDVLIANTTSVQGVAVSNIPGSEKTTLKLLGIIMENTEVTWSITGDVLSLTVEGSTTTYNRQ